MQKPKHSLYEITNKEYAKLVQLHHSIKIPQAIISREPIITACGFVKSSSYCPSNNRIYFFEHELHYFNESKFGIQFLVSHEYAHAMQTHFKLVRSTPVEVELLADCLAGTYMSTTKTKFRTEDVTNLFKLIHSLGDSDWKSAHHHGFPNQRIAAFITGYATSTKNITTGISECYDTF